MKRNELTETFIKISNLKNYYKNVLSVNPYLNFNHFRLCLATAIHSLKWSKMTHICFILEQTLTNIAGSAVNFILNNSDSIG